MDINIGSVQSNGKLNIKADACDGGNVFVSEIIAGPKAVISIESSTPKSVISIGRLYLPMDAIVDIKATNGGKVIIDKVENAYHNYPGLHTYKDLTSVVDIRKVDGVYNHDDMELAAENARKIALMKQ